jgi:membrane protein YdbS with pleckstrin-like domain
MTETETEATAPASDGVAPWNALPAGAGTLAMINGLVTGLVTGAGSSFIIGLPLRTALELGSLWQALAAALLWIAALALLFAWFGYRRWKATAWKLDATGLQVRRGRAWRKEILVPRSRVQHLDIERGPIERHFGLATLVVHTAGTRQHALRQGGLPDADAVALRDALVPSSDRHDDVL